MSKNLLIIISGPPCTGKSTLGKKIAKEFKLPFISKDDIKESLFNDLGHSDREWSTKLGIAAYTILHHIIETLLSSKVSFIAESNFKPEFENERFLNLKKKYGFEPIQIMCHADGEILFERFKKRTESGERHPGHVDHLNYGSLKSTLLKGSLESLGIGGEVINIDTTNFDSIDYEQLFSTIKNKMNNN